MKKGNSVFTIVLLIVIAILVLLFPKFYNYIETSKLPKVENNTNKEEKKSTKVEKEVLESLHYPMMRNSIYNSNTYYTLDKFTVNDMSNSDILYNAFLDIYEGNMTSYNGNGWESKQFNQDYIELRIKNILGKNINYTLESFEVPYDSSSDYKGVWEYDQSSSRFIYKGQGLVATPVAGYYNLEEFIKAEYKDSDIVVYKYVGFAKVQGEDYTIYSDAAMNNVIKSGTESVSELQSIFEGIDKKDKKIYKYTFKNSLCSYNEYCLYEGQWTNEL